MYALKGEYIDIGHFVSDNSASIRSGVRSVFDNTQLHLCFPHIFHSVDSKMEWKEKISQGKSQEVAAKQIS